MNHRVLGGLLVLVVLVALAAGAQADDDVGLFPNKLYSFSIHFENDMFAKTDRYYTNGTRLSLLSGDLEAMELPVWAQQVYDWMPLFGRPGYTNSVGISIGQNIYTPREIVIARPQPEDRPWAGWLYLGLGLHHRNARRLHKLELRLGVVGPESQAEDSQTIVHELRDIDRPEGWDHQLSTEPGVELAYSYKLRVGPWGNRRAWGADLIRDTGVTLGNVRTDVNAGLTLRAGWRVPMDFHSLRIDESGYAVPPSPDQFAGGWRSASFYAFAGVRGYAVAHDIFLDGNTFTDSPSVDRKPFVGDVDLGFGVRWRSWRLVYAQVLRTQEFDEQDNGQQFGSINVTWFF